MVVHDQHCRLHRIQVSHGACPSASVLPPVPNNQRVVGAPMPRTAPNWSIDASHAHPPTGGRSMNRPRLRHRTFAVIGVLATTLSVAALLGAGAHATVPGSNGTIIYQATVGKHTQLFTVEPDGSGARQLTYFSSSDAVHAAWSPDGSKVAFERDFPKRAGIYT